MKKKSTGPRAAIICAHHPAETDLAATIESARASAGKGATVYAVEDKDETGPGRNRHRGIDAAVGADVVIIIDAHMRFQGDVLARMVREVRESGGLLVPFCHHNEQTSFTANSGHYYAGARIVFRSRDGNEFKPLDAKWARDNKAGDKGCVMGACYAFGRDWYMGIGGQPLSVLSGWGCDEQLLSISAWMTGHRVRVIDSHVAHLWRPRPPWTPSARAVHSVSASRIAMIQALVSDATDRRNLLSWCNLSEPQSGPSPYVERLRKAMLSASRGWRQWKNHVCEPEEIDGKQLAPEDRPQQLHQTRIVVERPEIQCPNCRRAFDVYDLPPVLHTYPNARRSHRCMCGNMFMTAPQRVSGNN